MFSVANDQGHVLVRQCLKARCRDNHLHCLNYDKADILQRKGSMNLSFAIIDKLTM